MLRLLFAAQEAEGLCYLKSLSLEASCSGGRGAAPPVVGTGVARHDKTLVRGAETRVLRAPDMGG